MECPSGTALKADFQEYYEMCQLREASTPWHKEVPERAAAGVGASRFSTSADSGEAGQLAIRAWRHRGAAGASQDRPEKTSVE